MSQVAFTISTFDLTLIGIPVPGYEEFLVPAPNETTYCRAGQKNKNSYLGHGLAMNIGQDMFRCRLLIKKHLYLS